MVSATEMAPARNAPAEGPRFGLATATFVVVSCLIFVLAASRLTQLALLLSPVALAGV